MKTKLELAARQLKKAYADFIDANMSYNLLLKNADIIFDAVKVKLPRK